jgi:hypothetical protein
MAEVLAGVSVVKLLQLEALFQGRVAGLIGLAKRDAAE